MIVAFFDYFPDLLERAEWIHLPILRQLLKVRTSLGKAERKYYWSKGQAKEPISSTSPIPETPNRALETLKAMFCHAERLGYVVKNPVLGVAMFRQPIDCMRVITFDEPRSYASPKI